MESVTDQVVVDRVLAGDMDAYAILVERYQDRIYSAVSIMCITVTTQWTSRKRHSCGHTQRLRVSKLVLPFIRGCYRIAINASIDLLRKRKTKPLIRWMILRYTDWDLSQWLLRVLLTQKKCFCAASRTYAENGDCRTLR